MSYQYREVICPWCNHKFMWQKDGGEGLIIYEYREKETGEFVNKAKCPKCGEDMLVLNHVLTGVFLDDERIETQGVRGI